MGLAGRVVVVQAVLGLSVSAAFFAYGFAYGAVEGNGASHGLSALLAVGVSWFPAAYFAWVQARILNATRLMMHGVMKIVLTIVLMALVMVKVKIEPVGFFVTFAVIQLSYLSGVLPVAKRS